MELANNLDTNALFTIPSIGICMQFDDLINWYANQCNGDWEHSYGIKLDTLDNPGWLLTIDLSETEFENLKIRKSITNTSDNDWLHFEIIDNQFIGACSTQHLNSLIGKFFDCLAANE
jgi:Immunity protein 53